MSSAGGVFHGLLDELVGRAAHVPGSRSGSAIQDLVLSIELGVFFLIWLREWPRVSQRSRPLFVIYAMNLLGAAMWCALGVYIHLLEPLPTERTLPWLAFLGLGAVTPVLFPLVTHVAFAADTPTPTATPTPYVISGLTALAYGWAMATAADLSLGGLLPKQLLITPWHAVDGRSYGGQELGITFDLLTSYPCYRGDSMFVLSTLFLLCNALAVFVLHRSMRHCKAGLTAIAWRLRAGVAVMLVNCISILYLLVVFEMSVTHVFDVFHAVQGLVMAASFFDLRSALRFQQDSKSV